MTETSPALLQSIILGPLLLKDLPEATAFPHQNLSLPQKITPLKLQQKLGHLYEDALAQLLESSPQYDLLSQNLQIQKNQHNTVGELDFLFRDLSSGQLIHLELATKFYLAVETPDGLKLPGPDARDNYHKKLNRLRTHQLQLPSLFKEHLPSEFRNEPILTQHLVTGCLFDHISSKSPAFPAFINPNCRRGRWLHHHELLTHFPPGIQFQVIPKTLWPVPFTLLQEIPLEPWCQETHITRCLMLRIHNQSTPYFIVPQSYPFSQI